MKKRTWILTAAGLAALLILSFAAYRILTNRVVRQKTGEAASAAVTADGTSLQTADIPRETAPDFTVYDADGNAVSLSQLRGKPVVVNLWATWCPPCRSELPDFDAAAREFGDRVTFLMVDLTDGDRETRENAAQFLADEGLTFPVYFDEDGSAAKALDAYAIPVSLFVDADGGVAERYIGAMDDETLRGFIAELLK